MIKLFAFISIVLTLRTAVIAALAVYFVIYTILKFNKSIKWYHVALLGIIALAVGWGGISVYFIKNTSNRALLLKYGIQVFKRYFPLGSGYATYGGQMAYTHYSKLYSEFGFDNVWGLNAVYGGTANDNFWPMIMAQLGLSGVLGMGIICCIEFLIVNKSTDNKQIKTGILALFLSLMIGTIASADLTGVAGMIRYGALGVIVAANNSCKYRRKIINEKINCK
jgi:hypothetical protein